jgi:antitoxin component YwqK of YwqJK toxin-antitoxin module
MGTGTVIRYDDNTGKKLVEQNYKDDKLHGKLIFWNRQGEVVSEEVYQDGKLVLKIK